MKGRLITSQITPIVIRVQEKVEKAADRLILEGRLSTELLVANKAKEAERKARNDVPNKVVQKYGEIYGHVARRQIVEDEEDEKRVVNIREKRLAEPYKRHYKAIMKSFPVVYRALRDEGRFI